MSDNPLANFYRTKEIYVKLPTQGKWYTRPPNLTQDGEIGVYPMTVKDEILMNVPDSLYNGESLFELFKSIVPDILNPYEIAMPDVDVILLASRAATYDKKMRVTTECSHCKEAQEYDIDLPSALSKIELKTESVEVELPGGLVASIKPNTLKTYSANRIRTIETARLIRDMDPSGTKTPEAVAAIEHSIQVTAAAQIAILADSIEYIKTPDGTTVDTTEHIVEWLSQSNKSIVDALQAASDSQNQNGIDNQYDFTCGMEECGKPFKGSIEFNPSFFFSNNWDKLDPQKK
jgi:hypothetical protein